MDNIDPEASLEAGAPLDRHRRGQLMHDAAGEQFHLEDKQRSSDGPIPVAIQHDADVGRRGSHRSCDGSMEVFPPFLANCTRGWYRDHGNRMARGGFEGTNRLPGLEARGDEVGSRGLSDTFMGSLDGSP